MRSRYHTLYKKLEIDNNVFEEVYYVCKVCEDLYKQDILYKPLNEIHKIHEFIYKQEVVFKNASRKIVKERYAIVRLQFKCLYDSV